MSIDPKYLNLFMKATEEGAIGASKFIGKGDKIAADKGAVDPMRKVLNKINLFVNGNQGWILLAILVYLIRYLQA